MAAPQSFVNFYWRHDHPLQLATQSPTLVHRITIRGAANKVVLVESTHKAYGRRFISHKVVGTIQT
jgi:hypothetical protein